MNSQIFLYLAANKLLREKQPIRWRRLLVKRLALLGFFYQVIILEHVTNQYLILLLIKIGK
jgi:hypothetical protein